MSSENEPLQSGPQPIGQNEPSQEEDFLDSVLNSELEKDTPEIKALKNKICELIFNENKIIDDKLDKAYKNDPFDYDELQFEGDYLSDFIYKTDNFQKVTTNEEIEKLHKKHETINQQRYPGCDIRYANKTINERVIAHKFDLNLLNVVRDIYTILLDEVDFENEEMNHLYEILKHDSDLINKGLEGLHSLIDALESYIKYNDMIDVIATKYNVGVMAL